MRKSADKKKTKPKVTKERVISDEENAERLALTDYVVDLMGYVENKIKPPKQLFMRLEGLRHGEYIGSAKKSTTGVKYPYSIIMYTFMAKKAHIVSSLNTVSFKDESHKINYIMVIIEKNINDIFQAVQRRAIAKDKIENKEIDVNTGKSMFVKTEESKSQELFEEDMW